jgi:tetratricopeptide (TPR) repeat protein
MRRRCVIRPGAERRRRVGGRGSVADGTPALLLGLLLSLVLSACSAPPGKPANAAQSSAQAANLNGTRALRRGDLAAALAAYGEALAAAESVEDFDAAGTSLLNLAVVHARLGQMEAAHARLDRIVNAPQRYSAVLQRQAAARKALLYLDAGAQGTALHWADRAQADCAEPCSLTPAMTNLRAFIALDRGEAPRAAGLAARAAELAAAAGLDMEQANALRLQGRAETKLGNTTLAAEALTRALQIDRELGLPERIALDLMHAGENEERRGQAGAAREFYERAMQVCQASNLTKIADAVRVRLESTAANPAPR